MYWVLACCQYNCKSSFELKDKYIPFWSFFQWFLRIPPSLLLYQDCLILSPFPSSLLLSLCQSLPYLRLACAQPTLGLPTTHRHPVSGLITSYLTSSVLQFFLSHERCTTIQFVLEEGQWRLQGGIITFNVDFKTLQYLTSCFHFNICCTFLLSSLLFTDNSPCSLGSVWWLSTNW